MKSVDTQILHFWTNPGRRVKSSFDPTRGKEGGPQHHATPAIYGQSRHHGQRASGHLRQGEQLTQKSLSRPQKTTDGHSAYNVRGSQPSELASQNNMARFPGSSGLQKYSLPK